MSPSPSPRKRTRVVLLILNTLLSFTLYRVLLYYAEQTDETFWSFVVMVTYLILLLAFTVAFLAYNRFFYRHGITCEQLPPEWSAERKCAFIEDGKRRLDRSRWMLLIIFPLVFTFFFDTVELFIIDPFLR